MKESDIKFYLDRIKKACDNIGINEDIIWNMPDQKKDIKNVCILANALDIIIVASKSKGLMEPWDYYDEKFDELGEEEFIKFLETDIGYKAVIKHTFGSVDIIIKVIKLLNLKIS